MADEFEQLGLEIEMRPVQSSTFTAQITTGDQLEDMALGSLGGDPERLDPTFWLVNLSTCDGSHSPTNWCDPAYDEIALEQARTLDEEARRELVWEAQEYFQSRLPWWTVSHAVAGILYNSDRWANLSNPDPIPPQETVLDPWLEMQPTGDDRIVDWAHFEDVSTYNVLGELGAGGWLRFIYDPFLRMDNGELAPWAVTDWRVIDETTVEATLRQGMTFHDGEPVTADDAVFSINYLAEWDPPAFAEQFVSLDGAEKVDDLTFRIKLAEPSAGIFQALTLYVILPEHIWSRIPDAVGVSDPTEWNPIDDNAVIGSGPFTFQSWEPNQTHELGVHRDHWAAPDYDGIRRLSLGQADAIRAAMLDGTADFASQVLPAAEMERLAEEQDSLEFMEVATFNTLFMWMNHEKAPFDDYEFRKAMRLVTNKERVALEGWLGFSRPSVEGNVPEALGAWHNDQIEQFAYDPEQARQVLEAAGYGWDGEGRLHFPADSANASQ